MSNKIRMFYAAAHAGYDGEKVPLGGAAAICERLARAWAGRPDVRLTLVGPGVGRHYRGMEYVMMSGDPPDLVGLSELAYARFCFQFEAFATRVVEEAVRKEGPGGVCFLSNDISESADLGRIRKLGVTVITLCHVDVVEFFCKTYLRGWFRPERAAAFFEPVLHSSLAVAVPRVLRLIFKKQRESLLYSDAVVVPSAEMKAVLRRCYPWAEPERMHVIPWGVEAHSVSEGDVAEETGRLRARYGVSEGDRVLITLSRISPEKGIDLLLKALRLWESRDPEGARGLHLFICGQAAYMKGEACRSELGRLAGRLRTVRVHFPGYVAGLTKAGFLGLADLYIFPSRHDSYGLTLVEAMRAGLPVVSSRHHSARELVRGEWGRIVEWRDESRAPEELLGGIRELFSDRERLSLMGRRARQAAEGWCAESAAESLLGLAKKLTTGDFPKSPLPLGEGMG